MWFVIVRLLGILLLISATAASTHVEGISAQPSTESLTPDAKDRLPAAIEQVARLFYADQHDAVVREARDLITRYGLTPATLSLVFFQAESHWCLGQHDEAIRTYESVLPVISHFNNVQQRRFAFVFFRLGVFLRERRQLDAALHQTEAGLRLEPQNIYFQILLGELLNERGDRSRALAHFKDMATSSFPTNEERAVLRMKIDRLTSGIVGASLQAPDMRAARLYLGISIGVMALNDLPKDVALGDVCVVLQATWQIRCEVLAPVTIPDTDVFVVARAQYDGDRLLEELHRRFPIAIRSHRYLIAVVDRDLFGAKTNYVFSWQHRTADAGTGVISAYRFATAVDDFYEKTALVMRRLAIQAISTSGSMFGFTRPTSPECATAFPIDFREFQQKRARLCQTDEQQRDALLGLRGQPTTTFGESRNLEIERVYRAYYLE